MSKFRKLMAVAALLFASSSVFVACSDDDESTMGPISINSVQSTSSAVTLYWTIVPNSSCDGYNVTICEGTRANKGSVVLSQDFDNRTATATFSGLKQNTSYVAITKGIPSKSSGFSDAYTYELEFMTAPLVQNITAGTISYRDITTEDSDGNEITETVGTFDATWTALSGNAGTYTIALQKYGLADPTKPEGDDNKKVWSAVTSATISNIATVSYTFKDLIVPETTYRVGLRPNPSNGDWYAAGEWQYSPEFTSPAAQ